MANFSDEPDLTLNAFVTAETPLKPDEIEWKPQDFANEHSLWDFLRRIALAFEQYFVPGKEASVLHILIIQNIKPGQFNPTEWRKPASAIRALWQLRKLPERLQLVLEGAIRVCNQPVLSHESTH